MKYALILLSCIFACQLSAQQNGYYVTLQNDTVPATIIVKKGIFDPDSFYSLYKNVKISKSANEQVVFQPGEIHSFYVETHLGNFSFFSKPLRDGTMRFMEAVTLTSKANLYGYRPAARVNRGGGIQEYTIERADGELTFFENELYVKAKRNLKDFFANEPAILAHLDRYFKQPGYEHRDLNRLFKKIEQEYPRKM